MTASDPGLWEMTAPAPPQLPSLTGPLDTDVAIIGAGYTGLATALHLAEAGSPALVLEAHTPGWGASGRNTGWLEPNWWVKTPAQINALFGPERGGELTRWVASGPKRLDDWASRYSMQFEATRSGLLMATDDPRRARELEAEARDWQRAGVANEFLDGTALRSHIASDRYRGAIWLRDGMTLNPLALTRELARASMSLGTRIFAKSPVVDIAREGTRWRLTCPRGQVRARALILATDAYTQRLWPQVLSSYWIWRCAVVGSEPYDGLGDLMPSGTPFADLNLANVFTLRAAAGGRLVTSTYAPVRRGLSARQVAEPFMRKFRKVFPGRPEPRWQFAHSGEVGLSKDMLPRLCALGPDAWGAFGYSGTGINFALLLGAELARLANGSAASESLYPVTQPVPVALRRTLAWSLKYLHAPIARSLISRVA
jgi:glycine/D-amino acid oxidase-like deaminating enzyme